MALATVPYGDTPGVADLPFDPRASFDPRTIGTSQGDMTVLALARVCTDPAARGRKLGQAVVRRTFDLVDDGSFSFSLFQTTDDVQSFYDNLGAVRIHNRFVNSLAEDPSANPWWASSRQRSRS